jgi:phosphonate transport system substrate-binding protein
VNRRLARLAYPLLFLLALPAQAQQTLKVSAIPDEAPTELVRKFKPLGAYLAKELGMKVDWTPVNDYPAVVEGIAGKKIDLAWLGGFTFVQTRLRTGNAIPIAQRVEDEKFISYYIVPAASKAQSLRDLKGKTFAFGSPSSTSGHLMPRFFMLKEGINPDRDFARIAFSGAHDATVAFVASGRAEAGVLNSSVYDRLLAKGDANAKAVRILAKTPPYYDYNWTVRGDLEPALVKKLTDAFLNLDPEDAGHKEILDLQRASRFIATRPENYKGIEEAARAAGLLK